MDIHVHSLPGVDDGPPAMPAALDLLRALLGDGTTTVVCTPHVRDVTVAEIPARVADLAGAGAAAGLGIELLAGGEVAPGDVESLGDDDLAVVSAGPEQAKWVLLECPPGEGDSAPVAAAAHELRARGRGVVLAHPERSRSLFRDGAFGLRAEIGRGAVLQVSASSLLGRHGPGPRERAEWLLAAQSVPAVLASDAHDAVRRPPALRDARARLIAGGMAPERAAWLTTSGPARLLAQGTGAVREAGG